MSPNPAGFAALGSFACDLLSTRISSELLFGLGRKKNDALALKFVISKGFVCLVLSLHQQWGFNLPADDMLIGVNNAKA